MRPDSVELDCVACGACCTSPSARHVPVTGDDWERLGDDAERLTEWTARHVFMQMRDGRCGALSTASGQALCTIYERRPEVCRALARGGPSCEAERLQKPIVLGRARRS